MAGGLRLLAGYPGRFLVFEAPAVILATGGIGKSWKVTSNSWEYTGDGHALALQAGATLVNMEFVQFHPTGMVWPPSVRGLLVTESVRGDGGVLRNSEGRRFMFDYIPEFFKAETADTEAEARPLVHRQAQQPPAAGAAAPGRSGPGHQQRDQGREGSPHGGVFLDIANRRSPEYIQKRLPSMYHQFMELAEVDITKEPMEIGPTCHYVMGGVEVDPDSAASRRSPACTRPARWQAACMAPTAWVATRSAICWCSASEPASTRPSTPPSCQRPGPPWPPTPMWRPPPRRPGPV